MSNEEGRGSVWVPTITSGDNGLRSFVVVEVLKEYGTGTEAEEPEKKCERFLTD